MNSQTATADPRVLAQLLMAHVQDAGAPSLEDLSSDPIAALEASPAVRITWVEPASLPATCSIAAACDKSCKPPRLLVFKATSIGRRTPSGTPMPGQQAGMPRARYPCALGSRPGGHLPHAGADRDARRLAPGRLVSG